MAIRYLKYYVLVTSLVFVGCNNNTRELKTERIVDIDYSGLAMEAEQNKQNIVYFLNQTRIRKQYKSLFDCLLGKIFAEMKDSRRSGSTRRIVAGHNTSISDLPWQVSIRERAYPICGGSVVSDTWIVTAAHCLLRAKAIDMSVRLGSSLKSRGGDVSDVKKCMVHPRYVGRSKINDVGLMQLYSPLRFSSKILPITIVAKDTRLPADKVAVVSGWGKIQEGGISSAYLQSAPVSTIAMKLCRRSGLDRNAIDYHSMFCAGSFRKNQPDACQGDSGGPIIADGVLIGIVSWGLGCARGNFPGVYTRLANPILWDWVHLHISNTTPSLPDAD